MSKTPDKRKGRFLKDQPGVGSAEPKEHPPSGEIPEDGDRGGRLQRLDVSGQRLGGAAVAQPARVTSA